VSFDLGKTLPSSKEKKENAASREGERRNWVESRKATTELWTSFSERNLPFANPSVGEIFPFLMTEEGKEKKGGDRIPFLADVFQKKKGKRSASLPRRERGKKKEKGKVR